MGSNRREERVIIGLIVWTVVCFLLITATYLELMSPKLSSSVSGISYFATLLWGLRVS